jgi:hypothetical protein
MGFMPGMPKLGYGVVGTEQEFGVIFEQGDGSAVGRFVRCNERGA